MTCERCWDDAFKEARTLGGTQVERYQNLVVERSKWPGQVRLCEAYRNARIVQETLASHQGGPDAQ